MKRLFLFSLCIAFSCGNSVAQNISPCPEIKLESPDSPILPDKDMSFSVSVKVGMSNLKAEYKWTVPIGSIIKGQGTSSINVSTVGLETQNITATVEIGGLPRNCPNTFSETGIVAPRLGYDPVFYEYEKMSLLEERHKIDQAMSVLTDSPVLTGLFYLNFNDPTKKRINSRLSQIIKHFYHREYSLDRIIFVITKKNRNSTNIIFQSIKGIEEIECYECKILRIIKGADLPRKPQNSKKKKS